MLDVVGGKGRVGGVCRSLGEGMRGGLLGEGLFAEGEGMVELSGVVRWGREAAGLSAGERSWGEGGRDRSDPYGFRGGSGVPGVWHGR